jgi:hypothetical protein
MADHDSIREVVVDDTYTGKVSPVDPAESTSTVYCRLSATMVRKPHRMIPMDPLHQYEGDLVKVTIDLKDDVYGVETLWATQLGDGCYPLRNVPFLAYVFSEDDVVNAADDAGRLMVVDVARRSGHSTYRVFLPQSTDEAAFDPLWKPLADLGCTYERANTRLIAIDVAPTTDVYAVYEVLERGEQAKQWAFEEGHCGHPLRKE